MVPSSHICLCPPPPPLFRLHVCLQYDGYTTIFLGVHRYEPLPAIDGDMGWSSCDTRRKVVMFIYWNRLIDMDDSRLPIIVCKLDIDVGFINSLSKNIESVFTKLDLSEIFI